jgi:hypothetical protein
MNELFTLKYEDILTEFNRYIMEHPGFLKDIPDNALLVFIDPADPEFSEYNKRRAALYLKNDELPKRPVVYVDIGELAPVHSRLLNPRILPKSSQWATS